jgi:hypothetical protein
MTSAARRQRMRDLVKNRFPNLIDAVQLNQVFRKRNLLRTIVASPESDFRTIERECPLGQQTVLPHEVVRQLRCLL